MANINQALDDETLELIADDYGVEVEKKLLLMKKIYQFTLMMNLKMKMQ